MPKQNALKLLKQDHDKVKDIFDQFEDSEDKDEKVKLAREAIEELKIHDAIEEEIFYPKVREAMKEEEIMDEADEEHHLVRIAVAEISQMDDDDERLEAKFTVLCEMVRHHIKEEEDEMFPNIRKSDVDLAALGEELMARKEELKESGVPPTKEQELVESASS
jgi:hemerythrin superfamily protein